MRYKLIDSDLETANAVGIADANSSAGATVDMDGTLTSGGTYTDAAGMGRIIVITDEGADIQTGATYTLTGTNANNETITEDLTGPGSAATIVSTKFYKTLTSIAIASPVVGSTVDIGTRGTTLSARSAAVLLNHYNRVAAQVAIDVTGTCNVDILETFDNIIGGDRTFETANWILVAALTGKTADINSLISQGATAVMLEVNTYSTAAEIQTKIIQSHN